MSGGVDSSVAALLLKQQGYTVAGAYMKNWINDEEQIRGDCPWRRDIEDARAVAEFLGIEFRVVNLMDAYRERIVDYLLEGYTRGTTPNPDVMCNREIKFGAFLDYALREGFDAVATGHYARKDEKKPGELTLRRGRDRNKDQSYFLAMIRPEQLRRAVFPVGELKKNEVRKLAADHGLPNAGKKDSQGICFIGNIRMRDFLAHYIPDKPGEIVDTNGRVLGRHRGLHLYTLGQRRGIGVPSNTDNAFYVVAGKDIPRNRLIIAFDRIDSPGLYAREVIVRDLSFLRKTIDETRRLEACPRYLDPAQPATFTRLDDGRARILFDRPQRALAPGQIVALYEGETLLGGGVYETIEPLEPLHGRASVPDSTNPLEAQRPLF